jgi:hypothetical protein
MGSIQVAGGGGALGASIQTAELDDASVTLAKMADLATARLIGRTTAGTGVPEALSVLPTALVPAFSGDISNSAGSLTTAIGAAKVTNAMLAAQAAYTTLANNTSGSATPTAVTAAALNAMLGVNDLILAPSGAVFESIGPRTSFSATAQTLTSGTLRLIAVNIAAGKTVTSISFRSGGTGATTPTAWWFALYDSARALLSQTADQTTTAWAASTTKTLALGAAQTVTTTGLFYVAIMMTAATPCNVLGLNSSSAGLVGLTPILNGNTTDTGLTTTAPANAAAITADGVLPYCWGT